MPKMEQIMKLILYSSYIFSTLMRLAIRMRLYSSCSVPIGLSSWQIQLLIEFHSNLLSLKVRSSCDSFSSPFSR